ncbi:MAG: chitobiase/beta-hexosaminidase C-terminal domain-containing protein, partial [Sedimentisphaerales bacterium]|nr:chitobiase/beta-hexosaminidase C-terminal domain-containing protein [Sedimentisphaerales bacterium]
MGKCGFCCGRLGLLGILLMAARLPAGELRLVLDGREAGVVQAAIELKPDGWGGQYLLCPQGAHLNAVGQPDIPWKRVTVLLPPDVRPEAVKAELTESVYAPVAGAVRLEPVAPPAYRDEEGNEVAEWPGGRAFENGYDVQAWSQDAFGPAAEARVMQVGQLRQYHLADIAVPLAQYNPVTGRLKLLETATLNVTYQRQNRRAAAPLRRPLASARRAVERLAVNFDEAGGDYEPMMAAVEGEAAVNGTGYVIVTTNYIEANSTKLADFVAHKQRLYFDVQVITEDDFDGGYGPTAADNIRAWLQGHYLEDDIEYVLFIGPQSWSGGAIAMKWINIYDAYPDTKQAPSDYYFADLTGNWDLDGDGRWGECDYDGDPDNDDFGPGGVDTWWEVLPGRIPYYGSIADLDSILERTMAYELQMYNIGWRHNCLLPMNPLDEVTPAWQAGEQIKEDFLIPWLWGYYRIYDYTSPPPPSWEKTPCTSSNVVSAWKSNPFGLVVWQAHGSSTGASNIISTSQVAQLNDAYPSFTFQGSCSNSAPDASNNLSYSLLKHGCIATIGATAMSLYGIGETDFSYSVSGGGYGYQYAQRIVTENQTCGQALHNIKRDMYIGGYWRNFIVFNLYGDPSLAVDPHVIVPVITPPTGEYYPEVVASVSLPGSGWTIHYTTDGSDPDGSDPIYTGPITFTEDGVFKVWAEKVGTSVYSAVSSAQYTITPDSQIEPTIMPESGSFLLSVDVTATFPKTGWTIHYTTNGAAPTLSDPVLGAGATVTETCTFKARAFEDGGSGYSAVGARIYTIISYELFVDDNAAGDPGPGDPSVSDPLEDGSLSHPFDAIQEAVNLSVSGVTIIIQPGVYTGSGNRNIIFNGKNIVLRSTDPTDPQVVQDTVIDCQGGGRGIIMQNAESTEVQLRGLTISNGYSSSGGAGIYCVGASPVIEYCRFLNCTAATHGGGIFLDGGAAGVHHSYICGCHAIYGGGVYMKNYASPSLEHCLIVDNTATSGGGLCMVSSTATLEQMTVANNAATSSGGVGYVMDSDLSSWNSIFWGNTATSSGATLYLTSASTAQFEYCDVEGGESGFYLNGTGNSYSLPTGCYAADPCFVDVADGDYHLQSQLGHWDELGEIWVSDGQTSGAIDTAHPSEGIGAEVADPSNVRKNLGAYGGTVQASRTPANWSLMCDVNNDGAVD